MKTLFSIIIVFFNLICFGQCGYYAKITNIMKNKVCNNIAYQQSELSDLMYKMAVNCPDEASKFNKWYSTMKTDQDLKNYFCGGNNNVKNSNTKKLRDDNVHYEPHGPDNFVKKGTFNNKCFHRGQFSVDQVNSGKPFTCDFCKKSLTKETLELSDKEYKNIKRYTGNEDVDENGNITTNQNSTTLNTSYTSPIHNTQQQNSVISQFKEKPIEYSNNKTKDRTKDEEKKLLENIESTTNIGEFDESKINEILDIKEDNIKVAQEAYHIESRGRSPFFNIVVFSGYKAKFDGILDIDVSIDENGKLTSVSTASKPKDEELNRLVTNYIFEKYSKNREWSPAVGTNGRFISSNLNYKENFHRIIETAKVEQKQKPIENNKIDNQESENNQSYYQKFIAFKNGLINNTKSSKSEEINSDDKSLEITESMENDAKLGLLQLLSKPKVSMIEVRSYISSNIAKVNIGLRKIWQDAFNEMERMETENK